MEQKAGAQIGTRAFVQSLLILLALMLAAGLLTLSQRQALSGILGA